MQGSWQINTNETGLITFATLGTAISGNLEWIQSIVNSSAPVTPSDAPMTLHPFFALMLALLAWLI